MKTTLKIFFATTLAASAAGFALSTPAKAELFNACHTGSRAQLISCCQHYIQRERKPFWMQETGADCRSVVQCTAYTTSTKNPCQIQVPKRDEKTSPNVTTTRSSQIPGKG